MKGGWKPKQITDFPGEARRGGGWGAHTVGRGESPGGRISLPSHGRARLKKKVGVGWEGREGGGGGG